MPPQCPPRARGRFWKGPELAARWWGEASGELGPTGRNWDPLGGTGRDWEMEKCSWRDWDGYRGRVFLAENPFFCPKSRYLVKKCVYLSPGMISWKKVRFWDPSHFQLFHHN